MCGGRFARRETMGETGFGDYGIRFHFQFASPPLSPRLTRRLAPIACDDARRHRLTPASRPILEPACQPGMEKPAEVWPR